MAGLMLAGCTLQAHTVIQPDGSGEYRTEIGFSEQEQKSLAATSGSVEKLCQDSQRSGAANFPVPATSEIRQYEGMTWCIVTAPFSNLSELQAIYKANGSGTRINRLEIQDDRVYYDITLTGGSSPSASPELAQLGGLFSQAVKASWRVTVPGSIDHHDGDSIEGNTVIWNLDAGTMEKHIGVESRLTAFPFWLPPVLIGGGLGLVGVAAVGWARSRRAAPRASVTVLPVFVPGATHITPVYCPQCGQAPKAEALFCPECGTPRPAV